MIEYALGNHAWRPVDAEGYLVIHCLMVNGKLLVKKLKKTAPDPRFIVQRERLLKKYKKGLTILAAD